LFVFQLALPKMDHHSRQKERELQAVQVFQKCVSSLVKVLAKRWGSSPVCNFGLALFLNEFCGWEGKERTAAGVGPQGSWIDELLPLQQTMSNDSCKVCSGQTHFQRAGKKKGKKGGKNQRQSHEKSKEHCVALEAYDDFLLKFQREALPPLQKISKFFQQMQVGHNPIRFIFHFVDDT
jgi:hypothetical protein